MQIYVNGYFKNFEDWLVFHVLKLQMWMSAEIRSPMHNPINP